MTSRLDRALHQRGQARSRTAAAERIRAGGAGIGGFYTPTGYGTPLAEGKETRRIEGRDYVFELPIRADYALIKAHRADGRGNLVYRKTARNFGPVMATAATVTHVFARSRRVGTVRHGIVNSDTAAVEFLFTVRWRSSSDRHQYTPPR